MRRPSRTAGACGEARWHSARSGDHSGAAAAARSGVLGVPAASTACLQRLKRWSCVCSATVWLCYALPRCHVATLATRQRGNLQRGNLATWRRTVLSCCLQAATYKACQQGGHSRQLNALPDLRCQIYVARSTLPDLRCQNGNAATWQPGNAPPGNHLATWPGPHSDKQHNFSIAWGAK